MAEILVQITGYGLAIAALAGVPLCARDIYRARESPTGKSPDGLSSGENAEALVASAIVALVLPVLTSLAVALIRWIG